MPGYTHLQRAQPVYLSHHLLAYVWMLVRDRDRFRAVVSAAGALPLGSGALAGVNFDTDRGYLAAELGFSSVAPNSVDAVSNRDFVLDYLAAAATCATHLSRLGAEIVLWSSEEFGFCELSDAWASGSSIMPQKKNPDAAELLRAKAPRVAAHLVALHGVMHGLPLTYNKDMQEDKEHLFDAADTLELCLAAARGMVEALGFNRERLAQAATDEFLAATDVADMLVRRGVPFREAHGIVAGVVRAALEQGKSLSELSLEELAEHSALLDDEFFAALEPRFVAGSEGVGGRHRARARARAARASARQARIVSAPHARAVSAHPGADAPTNTARTLVLPAAFYDRPVVEVARSLVGCVLRHDLCAGVIVEAEAYHQSEPGSHAFIGPRPRTRNLFGPPGIGVRVPLIRDPCLHQCGLGT